MLVLSNEDLAKVVGRMDGDLLPRAFLYLDLVRSASVLQYIHKTDKSLFDRTIDASPKMPQSVKNTSLDESLVKKIEEHNKDLRKTTRGHT
jgi:hypothetical protein